MQKIVLATSNQGKVRELAQKLAEYPVQVIPQDTLGVDAPEETGLTFIENAILKARHAAKITGLPAIADDSGLAVNALGGAPGIYSARYAGKGASDKQNVDTLLNALATTPKDQRQATFHCVLVYLRHADDPTPVVCHGQWQGMITTECQGEGGFGYDPVFWIPDLHCTAAALSSEQKSAYSHRGQALRLLQEALRHV